MSTHERIVTFIEDATWMRATLEIPEQKMQRSRDYDHWLDQHLYHAMRGQHAKARGKAALLARKKTAALLSIPQAVGDMAVKGKTPDGKLIYQWEGREVNVTPRALRNSTDVEASAWKQTRQTDKNTRASSAENAGKGKAPSWEGCQR